MNKRKTPSIPAFNDNYLLPPFRADRFDVIDNFHDNYLSPYKCTLIEVFEKFGITKKRIKILKGLYLFRRELNRHNITQGYQWLYGSFTENIEAAENRSPNDLDIATFYQNSSDIENKFLEKIFPEFICNKKSKAKYELDHSSYKVFASPPHFLTPVDIVSDLTQLYTHNRKGVWKGILRLELNTPYEDEKAIQYLNKLVL